MSTMSSELIQVTEKAIEQIKNIQNTQNISADKALRVSVIGGGCSGLSYKIDFDQQKEKDNIVEAGGVKIVMDPKSTIYLKGITLDFQDGLNGKGFIFHNPNAKNTCGCGESFSI